MSGEANFKSYADYDYYVSIGGQLTEAEFDKSLVWATALLDTVTFQRLRNMTDIPDCVKKALCSTIDKHAQFTHAQNSTIQSESLDGWSVTYANNKLEDLEQNALRDIKIYLSGTGLTYRGRSSKYDVQSGNHSL